MRRSQHGFTRLVDAPKRFGTAPLLLSDTDWNGRLDQHEQPRSEPTSADPLRPSWAGATIEGTSTHDTNLSSAHLIISRPGTNPFASACTSTDHASKGSTTRPGLAFLCAAESLACQQQSMNTPLVQRSAFARAFVARAERMWRDERHAWRHNETLLAAALWQMWASPCVLVRDWKCRYESSVWKPPPLFTTATRFDGRRRSRRRRMTFEL